MYHVIVSITFMSRGKEYARCVMFLYTLSFLERF